MTKLEELFAGLRALFDASNAPDAEPGDPEAGEESDDTVALETPAGEVEEVAAVEAAADAVEGEGEVDETAVEAAAEILEEVATPAVEELTTRIAELEAANAALRAQIESMKQPVGEDDSLFAGYDTEDDEDSDLLDEVDDLASRY